MCCLNRSTVLSMLNLCRPLSHLFVCALGFGCDGGSSVFDRVVVGHVVSVWLSMLLNPMPFLVFQGTVYVG